MPTTRQIVETLELARLEIAKAMKDAETRGDRAGVEDVRKVMVRVGSMRNEIERAQMELPARRSKPIVRDVTPLQQPFRDSPAELSKRIDRLVEHFRFAEIVFYAEAPKGVPSARVLLWLLFRDAVRTATLLPDRERRMVSHVGTVMPAARAAISDFDAMRDLIRQDYEIQVERLRAGMQQYDHIKVRETASAAAADRMVDVMDLLRFVKAGRQGADAQRYKRTFLAHALGHGPEFCTRIFDKHRADVMSRQSLHDVKQRVLGQILAGIESEFGLVRTSRGFRRLTVREIERRAKARKRSEREAVRERAAA